MKKLFVALFILSACSQYNYIVSVDTGDQIVTKTNEIDTVQNIVSKYISIDIDSVFINSDYFGYYANGIEIYFERK